MKKKIRIIASFYFTGYFFLMLFFPIIAKDYLFHIAAVTIAILVFLKIKSFKKSSAEE